MIARRSFLRGMGALFIAAPAIVRASSLMPVKAINWGQLKRTITLEDWADAIYNIRWTPTPFIMISDSFRQAAAEYWLPRTTLRNLGTGSVDNVVHEIRPLRGPVFSAISTWDNYDDDGNYIDSDLDD